MRIGVVDADLIGRSKHRFPNLACMKISGYHKEKGDEVTLITEYLKEDNSVFQRYYAKYDKIYVSKVFVDTPVPYSILNLSITVYGGTGFFFANAEPLLPKIERHMPDYHLYDEWIAEKRKEGKVTDREFVYYEEYSIGYTSRGCVRHCKFCINQHSTKVESASVIKEFLDKSRPKICLLDDNVLAYENWKEVFKQLNNTGKWFEYKQGFDIRALTDEKAKTIVNSNIYINNIYFAFDNIKDKDVIEEKIILWKKHFQKNTHMYVLCGFDEDNVYDDAFWAKDIENTLERIRICIKYRIFPYIMRYRMYNSSPDPYRGMYINLGSWCNQRSLFSKWSLNEWVDNIQLANEKQLGKKRLYSSKRYLMEYAGKHPEIAYEYFNLKYSVDTEYKYEKNKNQSNYGKKKQQKVIFSIKHGKNSIKVLKVDKTKTKEIVRPLKEKVVVQIQETTSVTPINPIIQTDNILKIFKYKEQEFKDGAILKLNNTTLKTIPNNKASLLLFNFKNDELDIEEKLLLCNCESFLKSDGNLYICNTNLKSFTATKEFIEKKSNFKFNEVVAFDVAIKTGELNTKYCSRFSLIESENIFQEKIIKTELLEKIIKDSTKENDIILSFFETYIHFENLGKKYKRQWICVKKKRQRETDTAIRYLYDITKHKNKLEQLTILTEAKDIG